MNQVLPNKVDEVENIVDNAQQLKKKDMNTIYMYTG